MRSYTDNEDDNEELAKLKAEPWMVELLKLNPSYAHWGPNEDYMIVKEGWASPKFYSSWKEFGPWNLDQINECVNFYFEIDRVSKKCDSCDGHGVNQGTRKVQDDFYDFAGNGTRWCDNITQDEVNTLVAEGRLGCKWDEETKTRVPDGTTPTAEEVNACNRRDFRGFAPKGRNGTWNHDGINRWILVKTRATRLGVYGLCDQCAGDGHVFTEPSAHVNLVLWWLYPRKGASCGIEVKNIQKSELPEVFSFLKEAASRNAERFARVVALASK